MSVKRKNIIRLLNDKGLQDLRSAKAYELFLLNSILSKLINLAKSRFNRSLYSIYKRGL